MSDIAITVQELSKLYKIGGLQKRHNTLRDRIADARLFNAFRRGDGNGHLTSDRRPSADLWALKNVSFKVKQGEVLGVVGRNGAGKSTLLKILSRITDPSKGAVDLYGRVGSLLEVGTGFHPELTGRENIYLNGAILGIKRSEIERKFEEIVAFAEVAKFLDTPLKHYSSGMYMRLAFAVAAHLETEILLVDEVLAVGDMQFQKKCLMKIGEVSRQGRTVVFVSHDMRTIKKLCDSGIYLREGSMIAKGPIAEIISRYSADWHTAGVLLPFVGRDLAIHAFEISQREQRSAHIDGSLPFSISTEFEIFRDLTQFRLGIYLKTPLGDALTRSFLADWHPDREVMKAGHYRATLEFPSHLLFPGSYWVQLHASRYAIEDYLHLADISQNITVAAPLKFNEAHPGEKIESIFILRNGWKLSKHGS